MEQLQENKFLGIESNMKEALNEKDQLLEDVMTFGGIYGHITEDDIELRV